MIFHFPIDLFGWFFLHLHEWFRYHFSKRAFHVFCLGFLLFFFGWDTVKNTCCFGEDVVDRIVAIVNQEIITLSDLNNVYKPVLSQAKARRFSLKKQRKVLYKARAVILKDLIDSMLVDQEARRLNLFISETDIERAIRWEKRSRALTDKEFNEYLTQQRLTHEDYREHIRFQMLREKTIDLQVISKIVVTSKEIVNYYEKHQKKYAGKKQYHLRSILKKVRPGISIEGKKILYQKMEKIVAQLKSGASFLRTAKKYSEPPFAAEGGDLGLFTLEQLSPKIRTAIQGKRAGEFTSVVDTDQGLQILLVQEIVQMEGQSLKAATPEIVRILKRELFDQRFQIWLGDLRRRSHIKIITPVPHKQSSG